ncbi:hypothetical protein O9992_26850 [Vibrio lentus]|nr:hypothetical protein [Vibrio lentus]
MPSLPSAPITLGVLDYSFANTQEVPQTTSLRYQNGHESLDVGNTEGLTQFRYKEIDQLASQLVKSITR